MRWTAQWLFWTALLICTVACRTPALPTAVAPTPETGYTRVDNAALGLSFDHPTGWSVDLDEASRTVFLTDNPAALASGSLADGLVIFILIDQTPQPLSAGDALTNIADLLRSADGLAPAAEMQGRPMEFLINGQPAARGRYSGLLYGNAPAVTLLVTTVVAHGQVVAVFMVAPPERLAEALRPYTAVADSIRLSPPAP